MTWVVNWLIKPFTMYGIAFLFFLMVFKEFIAPGLATEMECAALYMNAAYAGKKALGLFYEVIQIPLGQCQRILDRRSGKAAGDSLLL